MPHIKFRYGLDNSRSFSVPLAKAILGLPVKKIDVVKTEEKNDVYNEEKIFTYEDLSSMGVVYLDMRKTLFKGAHFSHTFPNVKVALPDVEDIKLYKLNHRYPANEKVYRNPAPVESLTFLGFNENESANIFKRRERPFDSVDDLIEGLNIGDERLKKLKLDDRA
ncbi:hypothetical protein RhiirC2_863924 [Rhizophagus irregularis]|uniref:Uncharacterized protein n=1 Tax=Rhizophagus irregularis TaxID=588596 RepID=A0A2N1NKC4_9GLOM|nr:hypothetical protein RhiirC2_863924 [Rhizophagus irregularis]